jgi:transcriptional regulator with XRE-family HTH domain
LISITAHEANLSGVEAVEGAGGRSAGIGPRLRAARLSRGMSLATLAAGAGLTKGFLSQVERDLVSPSVGSLLRVCDALGVGVGELFEPVSGPLVRAADRPPIAFGGEGVDEFQLTPSSERRLQVIQTDIAPGGGSGDDAYGLAGEAEFVHVLVGTFDIEVDREAYRLAAGDSLTFDAGRPRRWRNASPVRPATVLWVIVPALR